MRVGWADDAAGIAAVQVAVWREEYAGAAPAEVLDSFDAEQFAAAWHQALQPPPDARNRVLVALERNAVRGFAVTRPPPTPTPTRSPTASSASSSCTRRTGAPGTAPACCTPASTRCGPTGSPGRRPGSASTTTSAAAFLTEAGWAPDGAHRELDLHGDGSVRVKQVRLHTDITEGSPT